MKPLVLILCYLFSSPALGRWNKDQLGSFTATEGKTLTKPTIPPTQGTCPTTSNTLWRGAFREETPITVYSPPPYHQSGLLVNSASSTPTIGQFHIVNTIYWSKIAFTCAAGPSPWLLAVSGQQTHETHGGGEEEASSLDV